MPKLQLWLETDINMTESKLIDGFVDSLWNATATDAPVSEPLHKTGNCDVVIVAAGFTGLNAALTLASSEVDVRMLEAGEFAIGSTGRSGGHVKIW